ncbi:MAG: hypothetical protein ABI718_16300 [Acidobacteriota bacterium]
MSNDDFPGVVRDEARRLAFRPENDFALQQLAARILHRVQSPSTISAVLSHWLAPVAAALLALTIASGGMALYEQSLSSSPGDLAMVSDAALVHEDFYRAAQ